MPTLTSLKQQKPGQRMAFVPNADSDMIAELLVAFANSEGGTILLGMDETGRHGNILVDEDASNALQDAETRCQPPIQTEWQQEETEEGVVVILRVERSERLHTLDDGRVLVRSGKVNRTLSGSEIHALSATKVTGDYETETVPGADREDLDDEVIDYYLQQRQKRSPADIAPKEKLLRQIGALSPDGTPTISGMLLFGKDPQAFLPHSRCVFVNFKRESGKAKSQGVSYGRREEIVGPLAQIIERAYDVIRQEMDKSATVRELKREDQQEYPATVVREALVNAVCHRDYKQSGRSVEVFMYDDRLEISSPGGLPAYITIDNIVDEHYSRNPRIVNGLFQWQYIEELGLGVDHMFAEMARNGLPQPVFDASPHRVKVILRNERDPMKMAAYARDDDDDHGLNERQIKALQYVQDKGSITNGEFRDLCPYVGAESLRLDLVAMVDKGLLLRIGEKRGTRYILK